jgi:hypothetical protein
MNTVSFLIDTMETGINKPLFTRKNARFGIGHMLRNFVNGAIIELADINRDFEMTYTPDSYWITPNKEKRKIKGGVSFNGTIRVRSLGAVHKRGIFNIRKNPEKVKTVDANWYEPVRFASDEARDYVNKILGRVPYVAVSA